ncbi:MAG: HIT domain-containing protein [Thermodesulfobacteriota bacterium]
MKTLWAPWRMEYIEGKNGKEGGCIFCAAPGQSHAKADLLLYRDATASVFMNRYPYANGHLLVAPARHAADLTDLTPEEDGACLRLLTASVTILRRHLAPDGFNLGLNLGAVAGAGIAAHLHWHLVPRWEGDHNFMAVLAGVRTIPEHIEATFDRLLPDFQALTP